MLALARSAGQWQHDTVRPRQAPVRALALAFAVGLGGLLVGLSVAPNILPGDTLHVTPRAAAGAMLDVDSPNEPTVQLRVGGAVHTFAAGLLAQLAAPIALLAYAVLFLGLARLSLSCRPLVALPAAGCRGPPARRS